MPSGFPVPRFPSSQPWWIALPLMLVWAVLAVFFFVCLAVWVVARFTSQQAQQAQRGLRALRARSRD